MMNWPRHPRPDWFPPVGHDHAAVPAEPAAVSRPLRVVLADDHAAVRAALRTLLESRPELMVVGEAANGIEAIALAQNLRPDAVVMDVSMPRMDGIEATRRLREMSPEIHVVGWSMHASSGATPAIVAAGAATCYDKGAGTRALMRHLLDLQALRQTEAAVAVAGTAGNGASTDD